MNYAELVSAIETTVETTFPTEVVDTMIRQAEVTLYQTVQLPALNKTQSAAFVISTSLITVPGDFLYPISFAVVAANGEYDYLLNKDVNFIRAAYPNPATTGTPKHYAINDATQLLVGPTPSATLTYKLQYGYYPESIVDADTTWLGESFDVALLNGSLIQASRYLKLEVDTIAQYEKLYVQAVGLLKNFGEGKLRSDMYRDGQVRQAVS